MTKQTANPHMNMFHHRIANPQSLRLILARAQPKRVITLGNNFWPARQPVKTPTFWIHTH